MMRTRTLGRARTTASIMLLCCVSPGQHLSAQVGTEPEVRQLVTFRFAPGKYEEAVQIFRERALPLYRQDEAMLDLRVFREVESPIPLDLVVVRSFRGMTGMDDSNEALRTLAEQAGTSMGALYGAISALTVSHDDQFVETLPQFANGDPSAKPLVALIWYRAAEGQRRTLLNRLEHEVLESERRVGIPSSTGRFLVSDGWDYLRVIGLDSLGDYHDYGRSIGLSEGLDDATAIRREVILAPIRDLFVR